MKSILISGAGIAGPTLAYWLMQYGFEPTIIEHASSFRTGGYIVDFWGVGYDVAERMNLLSKLKQFAYAAQEVRLVDRYGRHSSGFSVDTLKTNLDGRLLSIRRGDLAATIYQEIAGKVETIFGDSITSLTEDNTGIQVSFENESPRRFGLVVGADGLHSTVRNIVFGPSSNFEWYLGYDVATFSLDNYHPRDEGIYVCYNCPGKHVARFAVHGNRTVFFLISASLRQTDLSHSSEKQKLDMLQATYGNAGWECKSILSALCPCEDLYLDAVSQIKMPRWSKGRVVLIGDAAYCPSLLAGQGASLAMAGAYILAGELKKSNGNHQVAFNAYEEFLRPLTTQKQKSAELFKHWFVPRTNTGIFIRNQITKLFSVPLPGNKFVLSALSDKFSLHDYQTGNS